MLRLIHEEVTLMIPDSFDYIVAKSIPEAVSLLQQHSDEAKILAGGQSLIPLLRFRLAAPPLLIDILRISELEHIREADGALHLRPVTPEAELETSFLIRHRYPILPHSSQGVA